MRIYIRNRLLCKTILISMMLSLIILILENHTDMSEDDVLQNHIVHKQMSEVDVLNNHMNMSEVNVLQNHTEMSEVDVLKNDIDMLDVGVLKNHMDISEVDVLKNHMNMSEVDVLNSHNDISETGALDNHIDMSEANVLQNHMEMSEVDVLKNHIDMSEVAVLKNHLDSSKVDVQDTALSVEICTQEERHQYIEQMCDKLQFIKQATRPFIVDHEHKLIYCNIPKIGSTTWATLLALSNSIGQKQALITEVRQVIIQLENEMMKFGLESLNLDEIEQLKGYTKFVIVRNPYERLVSAYLDKIIGEKAFGEHLKVLKALYRNDMDKERPVTFEEFVSYIISGNKEPHWFRYTSQCNPCVIKFDYILKLETIAHDSKYILKILNKTSDYFEQFRENVKQIESVNNSLSTKVRPKYLEMIHELSTEQVKNLSEIYAIDFMQFGYNYNEFTGIASCQMKMPSGRICC